MRVIKLSDLPDPPHGKTGWPWTVGSEQLPVRMGSGHSWPKISVITPSYNYGCYIEETIRSVLLQGYPNLEYIIIDGGSSDDTCSIIQKYRQWIDCFVSETDAGLTDALLKGFAKVTGEWLGWQNADDFYAQNAFISFANNVINADIGICYGKTFAIDGNYKSMSCFVMLPILDGLRFSDFPYTGPPNQSALLRVTDLKMYGFVEAKYKYAMDTDLMSRLLLSNVKPIYCDGLDGYYRIHNGGLTMHGQSRSAQEACDVCLDVLERYPLACKEKKLVLDGFERLLKLLYRGNHKKAFLKYSASYIRYRPSLNMLVRHVLLSTKLFRKIIK